MLRSCYRAKMRTIQGEDPQDVVWYFVPPETPVLGVYSCFMSRNWVEDGCKWNVGVGEQHFQIGDEMVYMPWYNGVAPANYITQQDPVAQIDQVTIDQALQFKQQVGWLIQGLGQGQPPQDGGYTASELQTPTTVAMNVAADMRTNPIVTGQVTVAARGGTVECQQNTPGVPAPDFRITISYGPVPMLKFRSVRVREAAQAGVFVGPPCGSASAWACGAVPGVDPIIETDASGKPTNCPPVEGVPPGPCQAGAEILPPCQPSPCQCPNAGEREGGRTSQFLSPQQVPNAGEREGAITRQYVNPGQVPAAGEREGTRPGPLQYANPVQRVTLAGEREGTAAGQVRQYPNLVQLVVTTGEREGTGAGVVLQYQSQVQLVTTTGEREGTGAGVVAQDLGFQQTPNAGEREGAGAGQAVQSLGFDQTPDAGEREGTNPGPSQTVSTPGPGHTCLSAAASTVSLSAPTGANGDIITMAQAGIQNTTSGSGFSIAPTTPFTTGTFNSNTPTNHVAFETGTRGVSTPGPWTLTNQLSALGVGGVVIDVAGGVVPTVQRNTHGSGTGTSVTDSNFTATAQTDLYYNWCWNGTATLTPPSGLGWTLVCHQAIGSGAQQALYYRRVSAGAVTMGTWTFSASSAWVSLCISN